jgi:4-hydroxy-3-methylbut-2-enyl diphosphate reductase
MRKQRPPVRKPLRTPGGHYLVVFTLSETDYVCNYILNGGNKAEFLKKFEGAYSEGFDPDKHLTAIGVANQTTMLRGETEEVQRRLRTAMIKKYGEGELDKHFRFFDTICGATQDRQDALGKLLHEPLNLLLVIGGYNSSNTSHLAEMGEAKLATYFIKNAAKMVSADVIQHYEQHKKEEIEHQAGCREGRITCGVRLVRAVRTIVEDVIEAVLNSRDFGAVSALKLRAGQGLS